MRPDEMVLTGLVVGGERQGDARRFLPLPEASDGSSEVLQGGALQGSHGGHSVPGSYSAQQDPSEACPLRDRLYGSSAAEVWQHDAAIRIGSEEELYRIAAEELGVGELESVDMCPRADTAFHGAAVRGQSRHHQGQDRQRELSGARGEIERYPFSGESRLDAPHAEDRDRRRSAWQPESLSQGLSWREASDPGSTKARTE